MKKKNNPEIFFSIKNKEVIRIEKGKFFWKGKEVEDTHMIYERFNQWMTLAEMKTRPWVNNK